MLRDAKKHKTIVTNVYEKHFFICDIKVNVEQNRFKEIISIM